MRCPFILLLLATFAHPVSAAEPEMIAGPAVVIDGDTFKIGETVVRLFDVDAPSSLKPAMADPPACAHAAHT